MANIEITNNESATLQIWAPVYKLDQVFTAAAAVVYPKGMLLTLTAGKYVIGVTTGVLSAVLPVDVDATGGTGDYPVSVLIGGEVRLNQLGLGAAMTAPAAVDILSLQDYGIIAKPVTQLGNLDNQ